MGHMGILLIINNIPKAIFDLLKGDYKQQKLTDFVWQP